MREASAALIGRADFGAFASGEGGTRTVRKAEWTREGDLLRFEIEADAFLRGMVRAIVGTLLWVGRGKIGVERFGEIVRSKDRAQAGPSAPARGLCLVSVTYGEEHERNESGRKLQTNDGDNDQDEEREDE
jgi:tRNA pseudouridine38-40 synthase